MAFKVNRTKADLCSYPPYVIMGEEKVGKTTLFRDLVLCKYKVPERGLLISLGNEEGFLALDDINYEEAKVWSKMDDGISRGLVEIIDEVIQKSFKMRGCLHCKTCLALLSQGKPTSQCQRQHYKYEYIKPTL